MTLTVLSPVAVAFANAPQIGYFIDAPVTGLYYETNSNLKGFTQKGAFNFHPGDVVSFYLGKDNSAYLLTKLSGQSVITPTLSTTMPSRSINMTRLLLSLDETPEDQTEIELMGEMLADPAFQQQLRTLDLNLLDSLKDKLDVELVSVDEAVAHLNQSEQFIKQHFTSEEVIFSPLNRRLTNILIKKRDHGGRYCILDLRYIHRPRHNTPIGEMHYMITPSDIVQYPGIGDRFHGCYLDPNGALTKIIKEPIGNFSNLQGLVGCGVKGCTRSDLNGFLVDNYDDEGDWKYRTLALNFDPTTQLFMEKVQGLGPMPHIRHTNQSEMMWFTYPQEKRQQIAYDGIWKATTFQQADMLDACLLIEKDQVWQGPLDADKCPTNLRHYTTNVTAQYGDMWWLNTTNQKANLGQMNVTVRWYPQGQPSALTTWEYLPAGPNWDQGMLYRYQQTLTRHPDGTENLHSHTITEFTKQI